MEKSQNPENLFMFYYDLDGNVKILPLPERFGKILNIYPESHVKQIEGALNAFMNRS